MVGAITRLMGLGLLLASASLFASEYHVIGHAYEPGRWQTAVYEERYTPVSDDGNAEVHYVGPEGERIAEKALDYSRGRSQPSFELRDRRLDRIWAARWTSDDAIELKRGEPPEPEAEVIEASSPQVIDAGFDPFIQQNWERLMAGEPVRFYFAFPNRLTNVKLRAETMSMDESPLYHKEENWRYFRIRVDSALLSLFADSLYLAYEPDHRRLMVFRGRSNIPDATGDGRDVEIRYRYVSEPG